MNKNKKLWQRALLILLCVTLLLSCRDRDSQPRVHAALAGGGQPPASEQTLENPYRSGPLSVAVTVVEEGEQGAPRQALVFAPGEPGRYPVVQFQHGFSSSIEYSRDILTHLASYGFIVLSPQMYPVGSFGNAPSIADEAADAALVMHWAKANLAQLIEVEADVSRFGLGGHSRGSQVAWRVALNEPSAVLALAGVDPVDGDAPPFSGETGPLISDSPFALPFATHILGTGLGPQGGPFACAPAGRNHEQFYAASNAPVYHVVASEHGHNDMLDSDCYECALLCVSNPIRDGMRQFSAGQLVAYYSLALKGMDTARFLKDVSDAPVTATAESME